MLLTDQISLKTSLVKWNAEITSKKSKYPLEVLHTAFAEKLIKRQTHQSCFSNRFLITSILAPIISSFSILVISSISDEAYKVDK